MLEGAPAGPGFWSLTRYEDVRTVNRAPHLFSSEGGITLSEDSPDTREFFGSMIVLDDPRHSKLRLLVQRAFTPKTVAAIDESVRVRARQLVAKAAEQGECDFVQAFAAPLPLQIICDMLGIPESDEQDVFDWTNVILGAGDPDFGGSFEVLVNAAMSMYGYAQALGQDRLDQPDGRPRVGADAGRRRRAAADAGRVRLVLHPARRRRATRRPATPSAGACTSSPTNPDQRRLWMADFDARTPDAIEEIVRWGSPVIHMRRTANEDTRIGDQEIAAGDKVVMWYWSANRDETVFDRRRPLRHHPSRTPRPRSATAPAARTSASAPTSPGGRSR